MNPQNEAEMSESEHRDIEIPVEDDPDVIQVLDKNGEVQPSASVPDLSDEMLLEMYENIKLARHFDQRAISYQRQGRLATYAPMTGQEGSQVATSMALSEQDWLYPTYREHAAKHIHGVELSSLFEPLRGYREGYSVPDDVNVMPEYIPIATQVPQAMGMAWGYKLQGETEKAVLCHLGDGATSEGDFHEGLNFAGVFDVPAVFVCNNNQWAISVPRERQTASETIAQKAEAYGIEGIRVDGLDPLAVYKATSDALEKARDPAADERRPTLIESIQYRFGAHTTADDPSVYRDSEEEEAWRERDPIKRLGTYLRNEGILDAELEEEIQDRIERKVSEAMEQAEQTETSPDKIFEHVYQDVPQRLEEQREELNRMREKYGDGEFSEVLE